MDSTMEATVQQTVEQILQPMRDWLRDMVTQAMTVDTPREAQTLERTYRTGGQRQLARAFEAMLQQRVDGGDGGRRCPHCGATRRHKGRRARTLLTSVGEVTVEGVGWSCPGCGRYEQASQRLWPHGLFSRPMQELLCLLGVTQGSFEQAGRACEKLLDVRLSVPTLAALTEEEGRRVTQQEDTAVARPVRGTLVGSCDGTMVHAREDGWRELRAYRFDDDGGRRLSGAALEPATQFVPRLRAAALSQHADRVERFVFVSDAAEWIKQGVAEYLPEAREHVIDIYHAYQHVHEAARGLYGDGTPMAQSWARRWCDELSRRGGRAVWDRLRRARFRQADQQEALRKLLGFLDRHATHLDYPRYRREEIPLSSGPMESTCKQLGRRLKGPGMRWRRENITPMAALISLWNDERWDTYWRPHAA